MTKLMSTTALTPPAKGWDINFLTGEGVIAAGGWATCRLCEDAFRRERRTMRFCNHCKNGFCEGEHGNFAFGHGVCVLCGGKGHHRFGPHIYDPQSHERVVW